MDIMNLKENQVIIINNEKYRVLNMTKFVEKSSYWIEYKLQNIIKNKFYYLNIETSQKAILYEILNINNIELKININFQGEEFSLFEKGQGKVETYYGLTDVAIGDISEYYEYVSNSNSERILSIEKWKHNTEVSIGEFINKSNIRVLKNFDE